MDLKTLYTRLPSVDRLLGHDRLARLLGRHGNAALTEAVRQTLEQARQYIRKQHALPAWADSDDSLAAAIGDRVSQRQRMTMRPVFNLSGTVLHTNLGRAPMAEAAVDAVSAAMREAATLEFDLQGAGRGHAIRRSANCCAS